MRFRPPCTSGWPGNRHRAVVCRTIFAAAMAAGPVLTGCSPALNWRVVPLGPMNAFLPCKPDHAQRRVTLAQTSVMMDMVGCEADGALYAVSHVQLADPKAVEAMVQAWRSATLGNMHAGDVPAPPDLGTTGVQVLDVKGTRPDGTPVQAALSWRVSGPDIYQLAVFATTLTPERTETLFTQSRIR